MPVTDQGAVGKSAKCTITRPDNATPYTAGDVVGPSTGTTAAMTFAVGPAAGGQVLIVSVEHQIDVAAVPAGMAGFRLHMYNVTPPSALDDNDAFDLPAGDRAAYLGYIDLGTPVDLGSTLYKADASVQPVTLLGANLFCYLVTLGGYTPSALAVKNLTIHTLPA